MWVYLILQGRLCLIPDPTTYTNLFTDWNGVEVNDYLVNNMPRSNEISSGAVLARGSDGLVYLVMQGQKMLVPNESTFNQFYFGWNNILAIPDVIMNSIPSGVEIY